MNKLIAPIGIALCLGACATKSNDTESRTPAAIEANIDASTEAAANDPADTSKSRVHIDSRIIEACGIVLPQAFFDVDSAKLDPADENELHDVAVCLTEGPLKNKLVGVVGHTSPEGTAAQNDELGEDRAQAVASYLMRCGVESEYIRADSMGERLASEDPDDWPANRRVDIILHSTND